MTQIRQQTDSSPVKLLARPYNPRQRGQLNHAWTSDPQNRELFRIAKFVGDTTQVNGELPNPQAWLQLKLH